MVIFFVFVITLFGLFRPKFLVSAEIWYLGYFEYAKFDGDGLFFV